MYSGTEFGKTRVIDGHTYKLSKVYGRKSGANAEADVLRKRKNSVRIVAGGKGMHKGYAVYVR